jgi:predicted transcriptional regulator
VGEARRFVAARRNYFPTIDSKAEELAHEISKTGGAKEWLRLQGVRVRLMPPDVMMDAVRRYDRHNEQLLIDDTLSLSSRTWQVMQHIAYTALRSEIAQSSGRELCQQDGSQSRAAGAGGLWCGGDHDALRPLRPGGRAAAL